MTPLSFFRDVRAMLAAAAAGIVMASLVCANGPPAQPDAEGVVSRAELLVRAARAAVAQREWERALERYAEALEETPDDADLRAEYAGVLFHSGQAGRALDEYERVLQARPDRVDVLDAAVDAAMAIREFDRALSRLLSYPADLRSGFEYRLRLARAHAALKQPERAAPLFAGLAAEKPDRRDIRLEYLAALAASDDWERFASESAAYLERWPGDAAARLLRADALLREDRVTEARAELESVAASPDAPPEAWLRLADVRMACGEAPAEIRAALESVTVGRPSPDIRARIAILYAHDGRFHDAFASLDRSASEGASEVLLAATRAEIYSLGEMHRTALSVFESIGGRADIAARVLKGAAADARSLRRSDAAKSALRRAVILYPGDMDAAYRYIALLEERGEYAEAMRVVSAILQARPENLTAHLLRGRIASAAGDAAGAERDFEFVADAVAERGPDAIVRAGLIAKGHLHLVPSSVWRRVCAARPADGLAFAALAEALYREARLSDSVTAWEKAVSLVPGEPRLRVGLVEALAALGLTAVPERKRRVEEELALLLGDDRLAYGEMTRLSGLLVKMNRWDDVRRLANRMVSERPDDGFAVALQAAALASLGRWHDGEEAIRGYLALTPDNVVSRYRLWTHLGSLARSAGDASFIAAWDGLRDLLSRDPTNGDLLVGLGRLAAIHRRYPDAREYLGTALSLYPDDAEALLWLSRVESWDRRYDEALRLYDRYATSNPSDRVALLERARVLGWALLYERALGAYGEAIAREGTGDPPGPGAPEPARTLYLEREGKRLRWEKRDRSAAHIYDELLTLRADDPELLFDRGQIEARLGFSRRAADLYERTLLVSPGHAQAADALDYERHRISGSLQTDYSFRKEDGFGKAFDIEEHLLSLTAWTPELREWWELFWIGAGVERGWYHFDGFPDPAVWRGRVLARKRFYGGLQVDLWYQRAHYTEVGNDTDNWGAEARYKFADFLDALLSYVREDIVENYPTLDSDRQRDVVKVGLGADITRRWRADMWAGLVHVDDGNYGRRGRADLSYEILSYPTILKIACGAEYWDYDRQGRTYFAPDEFWQFGPSLHWRHYLNRQHYAGANELYYGVKAPLVFDNEGEVYPGLGLEFLWDITHQWQAGADASLTRSHPYDGTLARVWLRYRF